MTIYKFKLLPAFIPKNIDKITHMNVKPYLGYVSMGYLLTKEPRVCPNDPNDNNFPYKIDTLLGSWMYSGANALVSI